MITFSENWDSREGTTGESASTDLRYIIRGTDDDTAARDALVANSPAFYNSAAVASSDSGCQGDGFASPCS